MYIIHSNVIGHGTTAEIVHTSIMQPYDCLILTIGIYRDEVFRGMLFHCRTQKTLRLINIAYDGI